MTEPNETDQVNDKSVTEEAKGSYVSDQIFSILFPFLAIWYGPKYLIKGEYLKGIAILVIFAIEVYLIIANT